MDNQRLFLFIAFCFVSLMLWEAWQADYGPAQHAQPQQSASAPAGQTETPANGTVPAHDLPASGPDKTQSASELPASEPLQSGHVIDVQTDLYRIKIDTLGGDLREAELLAYPATNKPGSAPFRLLNGTLPNLFILQSGLLSGSGKESTHGKEPTHHELYSAERDSYVMADGSDTLTVPLRWHNADGVEVIKRYTFHRGSYVVDLQHEVSNHGTASWSARQYQQLQRTEPVSNSKQKFVHTYTGAVLYSPEDKYQKIKFKDIAEHKLDRTITDGWAAMVQHYFIAALIPPRGSTDRYYTKELDSTRYVIGAVSGARTIAAGASDTFTTRLFIGPKLQDVLSTVTPGLELTVDYGRLTVLAQPVFWLLKTLHGLLGNWGWAIVFVTLIIKLVFYKLSETSYRSMANMRKLTPRMKQLKERYADDRQKLNQAMMDMYKKEKINPLGGCLPIVVQIPVFIALYWVLLESVELRQAPFMLWITDLSSPDPFYVLPLLMGATMLIQQKLNPAPMDPIQARVMMVLPVVFTVFFAFFPSGLVLYWVVNNTLSITQQYIITRRIERGGK